jgi:hypothetical protein
VFGLVEMTTPLATACDLSIAYSMTVFPTCFG